MNILITGVAGFIGSHVGEYFINKGHTIIGIDNFDAFVEKKFKLINLENLQNNPNFLFHEGDIRDNKLLDLIFKENNIDLVVHLAAKAGVRPSIESITQYYDVNVNGTVILLESMKKNNVRKMIFASSSSVYGNNSKVPFSELDPVDNPISPYASTKKSGELLCHVYSYLYGFDITCLRFFTVYGPRQRPDLAIHKFTKLIIQDQPVPFYGDGSTSRDYTYIDDIVQGIDCAVLHLGGYHLYNLGESKVIRLDELIKVLEEKIGKKACLQKMPAQQGDVDKTFADISRAGKEIGYQPKTDLATGIERFIEWYKTKLK